MKKETILSRLKEIIHPEKEQDIVSLGMVENLTAEEDKIQLTLLFNRAHDPFASSIKRNCEAAIRSALPEFTGQILIFIKEAAAKPNPEKEKRTTTSDIKNIIAVSSAKGGVGKSTVTANLAVSLSKLGYRVGILDADIYGPSQPILFDVEEYQPAGTQVDGVEQIFPAENYGIKIMSIGFFINPDDALMWRGPMATNALRQMIHQTAWGELDFLLIDLPPGTGDVHLSLITELPITGAIIISTPQKMALADVIRGIAMFKNEKIHIPVLGLVENMAWFTPQELPNNRYYIFGESGAKKLAEEQQVTLLAQIPLIQSVRESADQGAPIALTESLSSSYYSDLATNTVAALENLED